MPKKTRKGITGDPQRRWRSLQQRIRRAKQAEEEALNRENSKKISATLLQQQASTSYVLKESPETTLDTTSSFLSNCSVVMSCDIAIEDPEEIDIKPFLQQTSTSSYALAVNPETTKNPATTLDTTSSLLRNCLNSVGMSNHTTVSHSDVFDLCIVGAGMFGSAAARHASAYVGAKVCLVGPGEPSLSEMPNKEIFGSYYDEGRIIEASNILCKMSMKRYRELEKLSGIDFYHPVGCLCIGKRNSPQTKKFIENAETSNRPLVDLSYNDIFERRFPYIKLKSDDYPLLEDFGAGYINPRKMVSAQKIVAKNQGCTLIDDVVNEVKPLMNGIHEIITENQGVIKAKRVLICTGAFTNFKAFPMRKLQFNINKETVALLKISFKEANRLSAMPCICYNDPEGEFGAYILPPILYPDGYHYLKIGHIDFDTKCNQVLSLEEVKIWYLFGGDPDKIERLSSFLIDILPGLKVEEVTRNTCVTSHNISGKPYIDRVSPTVTVAVVGNGSGAMYSDEVGRIAAILSLTGQWDSELPKSHFQVVYQN